MSEHGSKFGNFLRGLLVGGAIGYAVALLNAPRPGDETRQMLTDKSRELREKAIDTVQTTVDKTGKMVAEGRDRISETAEETRNRMQQRVSDLKDRGETVVSETRAQVSDTLHRAADEVDPDYPGAAGMPGSQV